MSEFRLIKTRSNLIAEVQSLFDVLAWSARHELRGESSAACRALLIRISHFIELLERDQRRELS